MAIVGFLFGSFMYFLLECDINSVRDSFVFVFFYILLRGIILIVCVILLYVVYILLRVVLIIECVIGSIVCGHVWDPIHTLCPRSP